MSPNVRIKAKEFELAVWVRFFLKAAVVPGDDADHSQLSAEEGRVGSDPDTRELPFVGVVGRLGVLEDLLRSARRRTASDQTLELLVGESEGSGRRKVLPLGDVLSHVTV
jgi:hypothetical protein